MAISQAYSIVWAQIGLLDGNLTIACREADGASASDQRHKRSIGASLTGDPCDALRKRPEGEGRTRWPG